MSESASSGVSSMVHYAWFVPTTLVVNFLPLYWVIEGDWVVDWVVIYYLLQILVLVGTGYFKIGLGGLALEEARGSGLVNRLQITGFYTLYWVLSFGFTAMFVLGVLRVEISAEMPREVVYMVGVFTLHRLGGLVTNRAYLHQDFADSQRAPLATMLPFLWGVLCLLLYAPVRAVLTGLEWLDVLVLDASVQSALAVGVAGGVVMVAFDCLIEIDNAYTDM